MPSSGWVERDRCYGGGRVRTSSDRMPSQDEERPADGEGECAQGRRGDVRRGEGGGSVGRGEGADAAVGDQEEGQPEDAAQGDGEYREGCGAAVQRGLRGEHGDDRAGQGGAAPGEPGALGLEPGVAVRGCRVGCRVGPVHAQTSQPTRTTTTMTTATTATT